MTQTHGSVAAIYSEIIMSASLTAQLKDQSLFRQDAFIAGRWSSAQSGHRIEVFDPASTRLIGSVPDMAASNARHAIEAADQALPDWSRRTAADRGRVLRRWFDLMMKNQEDLAVLMTVEQGKPLAESRAEIAYAASFFEWFGEEGKRAYGEVIPSPWPDKRITVLRQPVGVCAAITPWNFPAAMIARKAAAALAAGCTMVIKPSELTPFSALALAVLAQRAGVPDGVVSVVTGDAKAIGDEFCANPLVKKLSFTGSTVVGKLLMQQCAGTVKRLSLELGGNAPFIVFDDADIDAAVAGAIASKFRNAGQTCVCANRFLVQAGIYEDFVTRLVAAAVQLKVGNGLDDGVQIGPLIDRRAMAKVQRHVDDAVAKGARVLLGGSVGVAGAAEEGNFFAPVVLADVAPDCLPMREETFGPVAPVLRFDSEEEAVRIANATPAGLVAYFYTRDAARVCRVGEALAFGMVGINEGIVSTEVAPFGGIKESGFGREGSRHGLDDYLEIKYLCQGGLG